ncbi:histidine phosphatase family protein [Candidatus Gracilibacteria bacterium]|nr:histidine phosphatase family protein [Candidatus Gracilibacteria bacterium]
MTRLIFVRHGETEWNALRKLQGQADIGLSPVGLRQVQMLQPLVTRFGVERVVASDLRRTRETSAALGFAEPIFDPRLREADLGRWTARHIDQLRAEQGAAYAGWRAGSYTPPEAESWEALLARVRSAIDDLLALGGVQLVVTHGGPIRAACRYLLDLHPHHVLPVAPASLTVIDVNDRPRLVVYNFTARPLEFDTPD